VHVSDASLTGEQREARRRAVDHERRKLDGIIATDSKFDAVLAEQSARARADRILVQIEAVRPAPRGFVASAVQLPFQAVNGAGLV
jgi:hypothetical protein